MTDESPLAVLTIAMPDPPLDCLLMGISRVNKDSKNGGATRWIEEIHNGSPHRERMADGKLVIRPLSWPVFVTRSSD